MNCVSGERPFWLVCWFVGFFWHWSLCGDTRKRFFFFFNVKKVFESKEKKKGERKERSLKKEDTSSYFDLPANRLV